MQKYFILLSTVLFAGLLLAGCSDHQNNVPGALANTPTGVRGHGSIACKVTWPQSTTKGARVIPDSTASIVISVMQGTTVVGGASLVRQPGATSASCEIDNLPAGTVSVLATARDSSNTVLATSGWLTAAIQAQAVTPLGVNLVACPSKRLLVLGVSNNGQNGSLYALSLSDGSLTQVNNHTDIGGDCCVNHAGTRVAFESLSDQAIYTMNLDGSQLAKITQSPGYYRFSPDGSKLAISNGNTISLVNSFGGPFTQIADLTPENLMPCELAYSPDGSTIAFNDWGSLLGAVNVSTGQYTQLVNGPDSACYSTPTYSPDGNKIAFAAPDDTWASGAIDTINATGGNLTTLASSQSALLWQPSYSPDGSQIVFSNMIEGGSTPVSSITMTDTATGTNSVQLTQGNPQNLEVTPVGWIP